MTPRVMLRAVIVLAVAVAVFPGVTHHSRATADGPAAPPFSGPAAAPRGDFGGWATSRGRFTVTGDGRVGTTVGRFTFFDGGLTATRVGNATAWNDGRVSTRLGRYEVFSNGVVGVPTRGGMVFTPGFAPRTAPAPRRAATHHAGHPDAGR